MYGRLAIRYTFPVNVIIFVVHTARFANLQIRGKELDTGISYPSLKRKVTNLYLESETLATSRNH